MMAYLTRREHFADGSPPPKKPYNILQFKKSTDTLLQGVYGTGKSSNAFLVDLMQEELNKAVEEGVVTMEEGLEFIKSRKKYYDDYLLEKSKNTDGPIGLPSVEERENFSVGGQPYTIFGEKIDIPLIKGPQGLKQNKKSVEEGFKKLEKWLKDPTPENWVKTFGKNNAFSYQLRNYLQGTRDIGSVKGMPTAEKVFDAINVKELLGENQINKILELDTGGKGVSLKSKRAKTFGNLKFTMDETIETIKNFQNGEQWLRNNPDPNKVGPDGKNIYRKYANAIKSMQSETARIGGFPFGDNSEKKLWANLYRASYRGDRVKIVGEFANGNLPIDKDGKINWKMTNKDGVPAWKRVQFIDTQAPKNTVFKWGGDFKRGDFAKQIDDTFGEGFFKKSTEAYDTQLQTGSKRDFTKAGGGKTIKNELKMALLRNEALLQNPKATPKEINEYINKKAKRFNITEVHHPDGVGVNPYKTEPVFRYANREVDKVSQALKAGNIDLNEAKIRIDKINTDVGPIRIKLDDGYYGNKANTQKSIIEAAEKYKIKGLTDLSPDLTTADKIERPENAKLRDKFKMFGKYAKQIAKPIVRVAAPFVPVLGTAGMVMGGADVAKAAEQGFTSPDELGAAYLFGPEAAKGLDSLKDRVRGQRDETEEFVP